MSNHYDGAIEKLIDEIERKDKRTRGAARAELLQLRNDSKWATEYHERLQNLRVMLNCSIDELPAKCAQLRAAAAELQQHNEALEEQLILLNDTSATAHKLAQLEIDYVALDVAHDALEAAVNEARRVIERCGAYIGSMDRGENTKSYMMCDAWLAAHPAPAAAEEQGR